MITISRETDYAARVILHLSMQEGGERATAEQIATERLIPKALVRRVGDAPCGSRPHLDHALALEGGIELARHPAEISLLQVVEAMEGPLALNRCAVEPHTCPLSPTCSVHEVWCRAKDIIRLHLDQITFEQLAGKKESASWTH